MLMYIFEKKVTNILTLNILTMNNIDNIVNFIKNKNYISKKL